MISPGIAAVLQLGLIIFDFVMDVLFAYKKAPEVEWLYIPNTIILILSLTINLILTRIIIYKESSSNQKFKKWSSANMIVVSIFTLLASTYIGALNILQSVFKTEFGKFSKASRNKVLWGSYLDILVEDLPQFIILILYIRTGFHDVITLLALVSSCLTLTVHVILNLVVRHFRDKRDIAIVPSVPSDDGLAGGEVSVITPPTKGPHPLQFTPKQDNNREIEVKPLSQGKTGGDDGKGKVAPDVIVDSQVDMNNEEAKLNKRESRSSFKEMI